MRRVVSAVAATSTILLATCDLEKITKPSTKGGPGVQVNFTITGGTAVALGGTLPLSVTSAADLSATVTRWSSSNLATATVDSLTGIVTGVGLGSATIRARLLGIELDTGVVQSHAVAVNYKGIRIAPIDSIEGLGLTRAISAHGLNASDTPVGNALSNVTWTSRDETIFEVAGQTVRGKKAGAARLVGEFNGLRDSILMRVRPVAKSITFADTVFTANALNFNRIIPVTVRDVADSIIVAPTLRWSSSDTNKVSIDSMTGVLRVKVRDTARVFVRVDTVTRSQKVRLIQVPGIVEEGAGTGQTMEVLKPLPGFVSVHVKDSGGTAMPGVEVVFRTAQGVGAVLTDSIVMTDATGEARLGSWTLGPKTGTYSIIATAGDAEVEITAIGLPGSARKLAFSVHPASAAILAAIAPAMKIEVRDSLDNLVTTATNAITLTFGTKPNADATLGGTATVSAVAGVATFSNITVNASGAGYTLIAGATGLAGAVSNSFDVFGTPTKLGFLIQPVGSSAGGVMQQVRVAVQDAQGATVTTATDNVTIALGNAGAAILGGTKTVAAIDGIAYFNDLSVSAAGAGYTLTAAAASRASATSSAFTVSAVGTPSSLAFSVQPADGIAGQPMTPAIKVRVLDQHGAQVTNSSQQITLSLENGSQLSGTFAVNASSGEATFNNVIVNASGTGYKLVAAAIGTSIASATSTAFTVTAGAASRLGFIQQPTHTVAGQTMSPAVRVAVQDGNGNIVSSHPATAVTLTLTGGGCTPSALTGGGPVSTVNGVATFSSVAIASQMSGCQLVATATGLSSSASSFFAAVGPTGPVKLAFTTEPSASTTAGTSLTAGTVSIKDVNGNNTTAGTSIQIAISVLSGPGSIHTGTTSLSTTTSATFSNIVFRRAGTYRLLATATGFAPDTSAEFTITAGPANRLGFLVLPQQIVAGVPFAEALQVAVQDQYENTVTGATNPIRLTGQLTQSPFTGLRLNNGLFEMTVTAVNGVATFTGLSVRTAASSARLNVNSLDTFFGSSNTFAVLSAPLSSLGFKTQPNASVQAGASLGAIEVQGQDSVGNIVSTFSNPVTLTLIGGDPAAVLNGTKTQSPASGVATFSGLTIHQAANGYQLSASAAGVATATSSAFSVSPGSATKLGWISQPQSTFVNAPLNPAGQLPQIAVQDQFGNTVNWGSTIRLTIASPVPAGMKFRDSQFGTPNDITEKDISTCDPSGCDGIATIPATLAINTHGAGVKLQATAPFDPSFTLAVSDTFTVGAFATKTKVGFTQQPTNSSYGIDFNPTVKLAIQDQYGNTDTTATDDVSLTLSTNPTSATVSVTSQAAVKGSATITPLTLNKAGTGYIITASVAGLTSAVSSAFNVTSPGQINTIAYVCDMTRQGNTIYYIECSNSAKLYSVPVTGGTPTELAIGIANPQRILADANNVYWIESGTGTGTGAARKYSFSTKQVSTLASGLFDTANELNTFATDGTNLYFVARNQAGTTTGIRSVPVTAVNVTPTDVVSPGSCLGCRAWFVVSGGNIFYHDFSIDAIRRVPTSGGTPVTVSTTGIGNVQLLAMNGTTLLLSHRTNLKTIANAPTATSSAPVDQISTGLNLQNWTVDGAFLYANNNSSLVRYSLSDFAAVTSLGAVLANDNRQSILTDSTDAFGFSCDNGCVIRKVPK